MNTLNIAYGGSMPAPFPMTEKVAENQNTHAFFGGFDPDDGMRCSCCDCRMLSISSEWPCGTRIPRIPWMAGSEEAFMLCMAGLASPLDSMLAEAVAEAREIVRAAALQD